MKNSFPMTILVMAVAALSVFACGGPPPSVPVPTTDLRSKTIPANPETRKVVQPTQPVPVEPSPTPVPTVLPDRAASSATRDEVEELVRGNSAFAFDLYRTLSAEDGNMFFSPYSISIALGMTFAGARGETESQMADTLHFMLPPGQATPRVQHPLPGPRLPRWRKARQRPLGIPVEHRKCAVGTTRLPVPR